MEASGIFQEQLLPSLAYTLSKTSSAIIDRKESTIRPRGATSYSPTTARTIDFTISDSSSYFLWNSIRLQYTLVNTDGNTAAEPRDLELLGCAHAMPFSTVKLTIGGQVCEIVESYNKVYSVLDSLLPQTARSSDGASGLPLLETAATPNQNYYSPATLAGNAALTRAMINAGIMNGDEASRNPAPKDYLKAVSQSNKYRPIPGDPGLNSEIVNGPLALGMCATGFAHPTPHSPVSISLTLVPTCQEILHCNEDGTSIDYVAANDATGRRELRGRSNAWRIDNPVLKVSFITLNSAVQAAYDRELASSGLVMEMRTYSVITSAIQQSMAEIPFFIVASNLTGRRQI